MLDEPGLKPARVPTERSQRSLGLGPQPSDGVGSQTGAKVRDEVVVEVVEPVERDRSDAGLARAHDLQETVGLTGGEEGEQRPLILRQPPEQRPNEERDGRVQRKCRTQLLFHPRWVRRSGQGDVLCCVGH